MIQLKRVYDKAAPEDGKRFLVERLWPRGITKSALGIDAWLKELGPSTSLRKWFGHEPKRWEEFRRRYFHELEKKAEAWQGGRNSTTLVKNEDFRIVLTVLQSNALVHEHKATGRISVQALSGHIQMHVEDKVFDLPAGHLLALDRALPHDVKALEDSAFLLTIAWPEAGQRHLTEY